MDILITDFGWQLSADTSSKSDLQPFILIHFWAYLQFYRHYYQRDCAYVPTAGTVNQATVAETG